MANNPEDSGRPEPGSLAALYEGLEHLLQTHGATVVALAFAGLLAGFGEDEAASLVARAHEVLAVHKKLNPSDFL